MLSIRVRLIGTIAAALAVTLALGGCSPAAVPPIPARPADLIFVIPRGAAEAEMRGEESVPIPSPIHLRVGQRVVIRNDDHAMHYFFEAPISPGETLTRAFPEPGRFIYSGMQSCSLTHATSLVVEVSAGASLPSSGGAAGHH